MVDPCDASRRGPCTTCSPVVQDGGVQGRVIGDGLDLFSPPVDAAHVVLRAGLAYTEQRQHEHHRREHAEDSPLRLGEPETSVSTSVAASIPAAAHSESTR